MLLFRALCIISLFSIRYLFLLLLFNVDLIEVCHSRVRASSSRSVWLKRCMPNRCFINRKLSRISLFGLPTFLFCIIFRASVFFCCKTESLLIWWQWLWWWWKCKCLVAYMCATAVCSMHEFISSDSTSRHTMEWGKIIIWRPQIKSYNQHYFNDKFSVIFVFCLREIDSIQFVWKKKREAKATTEKIGRVRGENQTLKALWSHYKRRN